MLFPYQIETLLQERPWVNWLFIAACCLTSFAFFFGELPVTLVAAMVLDGWSPSGLAGHMLLHADLMHLIGNMVFLWVFGNAVCGNIRNVLYLIVFPVCGAVSAICHNLIDGTPAIGASGAINGIVGFALAMYPLNRVHMIWFLLVRSGSFSTPAWAIILVWLGFDLWGALSGAGGVAYWVHIGGMATGVTLGLMFLRFQWVQLTRWDHRSLLDILRGDYPDYESEE